MTITYTLEEQKENRKLWISALRSGNYIQGTGMLSCDGMFCCLGVLADITPGIKKEQDLSYSGAGSYDNIILFDDVQSIAPASSMNFVGLRTDGGNYTINIEEDLEYESDALYRDNDTYNLTFDQIADIIEYEPEGLFNV